MGRHDETAESDTGSIRERRIKVKGHGTNKLLERIDSAPTESPRYISLNRTTYESQPFVVRTLRLAYLLAGVDCENTGSGTGRKAHNMETTKIIARKGSERAVKNVS